MKKTPPRALLVGTDPAALRLCRDIVESSGFVVEAVDSGIAAVIAARRNLPQVIFMDWQLCDAPCREVIAWLRANPALHATPIITLSSSPEDEADTAAASPGAVLRKPVLPVTIRRVLGEVLDSSSGH